MSDPLADLLRWRDELKKLPERIAYIVLDHSLPAGAFFEDRDAKGQKFGTCSPSMLDAMKHVKQRPPNQLDMSESIAALSGIPVYRAEDMPDDWKRKDG